MPRGLSHRLKAKDLKTRLKPGLYADGNNLYLSVQPGGTRSWSFRYRTAGKDREIGLGAADPDGNHGLTLAEARQKAVDVHRLRREGIDPLAEKKRLKAEEAAKTANSATFKQAVTALLDVRKFTWKNPKHAWQWEETLSRAYPALGDLDVRTISPRAIAEVVKPVIIETPETGRRMLGRIRAVLDHAKSQQWRTGDNPADWRGFQKTLLPCPKQVRAMQGGRQRQPALPWKRMPEFWQALAGREQSTSQLALKMLILTALRTSEVLGVTWSEINLDEAAWTIPARRMKVMNDRQPEDHVVPLTPMMVEVLRHARTLNKPLNGRSLVFPGRPGRTLSNMALNQYVRGMNDAATKACAGADDLPYWHDHRSKRRIVPHGFRSTFRDFGREAARVMPDVLELCLAHRVANEVAAAYARATLLDLRREAHLAWERFIATGEVHRVDEIIKNFVQISR